MNVLLTVSSNLCKQFVDKHGTSLGIKARYFSTESLIKKLRTTSSRPGHRTPQTHRPTGHRVLTALGSRTPGPKDCARSGAGDGNRTRMTSLEGWGSAIELHPRCVP